MKIKNLITIVTLSACMAVALPAKTYAAASAPVTATVGDPEKDAKLLQDITRRVTEIQNMDKSNLSAAEKKALRKELMGMKNKADGLGKGVYLSIGAIIIIILILILVLR